MKNLIEAVKAALQANNWYGAMFIAITIPDICGKIDNPQMTSTKERYTKWFDQYLKETYIQDTGTDYEQFVFLTGDDLFALRCSMLHEGSTDIDGQRAQEILNNFKLSWNSPHLNFLSDNNNDSKKILVINVKEFCKEICTGVEKWIISTNYNDNINLVIHTAPFKAQGITIGVRQEDK